jgi:hypothetical protein
MKTIRIILFILIIIGLGLLATQKLWVPKLVDKIVKSEQSSISVNSVSEINISGDMGVHKQNDTNNSVSNSATSSKKVTDQNGGASLGKLKLSSSQTIVNFGDGLSINITPQLNNSGFKKSVPITLSIVKPDGTKSVSIKTSWPLPLPGCDPDGSANFKCPVPDPYKTASTGFTRLSGIDANFELLKSGTYHVIGKAEGDVLTIIGFDFQIDSSQAEKLIVNDYKLTRFDALHQSSYVDYQISYGDTVVDVYDAGSSQNAQVVYDSNFNVSISPEVQTQDQKNYNLKKTDYYKALAWISGNYVIRIIPYLPTDDTNKHFVAEHFNKYPPNN